MTLDREIRFDGWTFRERSGELQHADGRKVRLQSQPLQVLVALLERPGEMIAREQLIERLWPKGVVDFDTALNSAVRRLRTALGDQADTPRYIETLPKRGYRFIATVEASAPAADPPLPADPAVRPADHVVATAPGMRPFRTLRWPAVAAACAVVVALAVGAWIERRGTTPVVTRTDAPAEPVPAAATERFEQARFLLHRRGPGDVARAREHYTAVLRIAPRHSRAWAGLASTWWIDTMEGRVPYAAGLARTREAAIHALQIEPGLAEAHLRVANVAWRTGDRAVADAHVRAAMAADPDDPLVLSFAASTAVERGALAEAVGLQRRAVQADPLSIASRYNLAVMLFIEGRFAEAKSQLLDVLDLHPGSDDDTRLLLAQSLVLNEEAAAALAVADGMRGVPQRLQARALALHALGREAESDAALRELAGQPLGRRSYLLAEAYAFRGDADAAFAYLQATLEAGAAACTDSSCWPLDWMQSLPLLRPLHADARWSAWVAEARARSSG